MEETGIIWRKIEPDKKYRVWKKDFKGKAYYNILVQQKNYDETVSKYYIPITFKRGVDIPNETDIIIKQAIENLRPNKSDAYNPIFSYMITKFEIVERQEQKESLAYQQFQETLNENEIKIEDAQLPF